jgi:hypothetical protein
VHSPLFAGTQEEHVATPLPSGAGFYMVFRTVQGVAAYTISRDKGVTWQAPASIKEGFARENVKHPRANVKALNLNDGRFLLWNHFNGTTDFLNRNPAWVCPGREVNGDIEWSAPEVLLYSSDPTVRMSYPDLYASNGHWYVTQTDKSTARVTAIPDSFISEIFQPVRTRGTCKTGLVFQAGAPAANGSLGMLPPLSSLTATDAAGFTVEFAMNCPTLDTGRMLLSTMDANGRGWSVQTAADGALLFTMSDGTNSLLWTTDATTFRPGVWEHVTIHVDAAAKLVSVTTNGHVQTGGTARQFGWTRFSSALGQVNGYAPLWASPTVLGNTPFVRIYDRPLLHCQAIGNYFSLGWLPVRTVIRVTGAVSLAIGQVRTFTVSSDTDLGPITDPVYRWTTDEGLTGTGTQFDASFSTTGPHRIYLSVASASDPRPSNGAATDVLLQTVVAPANVGTVALPAGTNVLGLWNFDGNTQGSSSKGAISSAWVGDTDDYSPLAKEGGYCAIFDGLSYVNLGNMGTTPEFTLAFFVRGTAGIANDAPQGIVSRTLWEAGSLRTDFHNNAIWCTLHSGGTNRASIATPAIPPDQWVHVAITGSRKTGLFELYLNGRKIGSTSTNGLATDFNFNNLVAGWEEGTRYLTGRIDDIVLCSSVLAAADIRRLASTVEPVMPASVPTSLRIDSSGRTGSLGWPSTQGALYWLAESTDLVKWKETGSITLGNGGTLYATIDLTNPALGGNRHFYRLQTH